MGKKDKQKRTIRALSLNMSIGAEDVLPSFSFSLNITVQSFFYVLVTTVNL